MLTVEASNFLAEEIFDTFQKKVKGLALPYLSV
jgi:hypothetical protein